MLEVTVRLLGSQTDVSAVAEAGPGEGEGESEGQDVADNRYGP